MFGKTKQSGNDKFVMAQGRKNGNLKAKMASPGAPAKTMSVDKLPSVLKTSTGDKPLSKGKANTFNVSGKR